MYAGYTTPTAFEQRCAKRNLDPQLVIDGIRHRHRCPMCLNLISIDCCKPQTIAQEITSAIMAHNKQWRYEDTIILSDGTYLEARRGFVYHYQGTFFLKTVGFHHYKKGWVPK